MAHARAALRPATADAPSAPNRHHLLRARRATSSAVATNRYRDTSSSSALAMPILLRYRLKPHPCQATMPGRA